MKLPIPATGPAIERLVSALAVLLAAFVASALLAAVHDYFSEWYFLDRYWMLEAAQEIATTGVNRLRFLPNSSYGIDILLWTHHLPAYLYAIGVALFDIRSYDLTLIRAGELLLSVAAVAAVFRRFLPLRWALALTAVTFLEPVFHFTFIHGEFMRWTLIFGLISFLCLEAAARQATVLARRCLDLLAGATAVLAPLCFVSLGMPILLGLAVAFLVEIYAQRETDRGLASRLACFALGGALPLAGLAAYLLVAPGIEDLEHLWICMMQYAPQVTTGAGQQKSVLRVGYYLATLFASPWGVTLLPVGLAATGLNLVHYRGLGPHERFLTRSTAILTGTWLVCALIAPSHIHAARMMWLLPFLLLAIVLALRSRREHPFDFLCFAVASACSLITQAAYHALGQPGGIYSPAFAAPGALALLLAVTAIVTLQRRPDLQQRVGGWIDRHAALALAALLVLVLAKMLLVYGKLWAETLPPLVRGEYREPIVMTLARGIREIADRELAPGDWVLSNASVREFFPDGVQRQEMFTFRRTRGDAGIGGAREAPAHKAFLLHPDVPPPYPTELFAYGTGIGPGRSFYYGGFVYRLGPRIEVAPGFMLLIGTPIADDAAQDVAYPTDAIPRNEIMDYLRWRKEVGLPVR